MASQVNSAVLQFADDLKMLRAIHDISDFHQLQADIDSLVAWANKWQLRFNVSKCHLLHLGRSQHYSEYNIHGNLISLRDSIKDMGVFIDDKLKFHTHAASMIAKANCTLAVIHKSLFSFHKYQYVHKPLIRPVKYYLGPYYTLHQRSIEKIQTRVTTMIVWLYNPPYSKWLAILKLPSLQYCHLRGNIIMLIDLFILILDLIFLIISPFPCHALDDTVLSYSNCTLSLR